MSTLLADARARARAAGRDLVAHQRTERRALLAAGSGDVTLDEVRTAIRSAAFAERDAEHAALLVVALERVLKP